MLESNLIMGFLLLLSFITSAITASMGMGGGLMLLSILPSLLPPQAIIPVHGAVQLSSNFSRFVFGMRDLYIKPLLLFTVGGVLGAYFSLDLLQKFNNSYIPLILSVFILMVLWTSFLNMLLKMPGKYFSLGIFQTSISLYVGATGLLSTSFLLKEKISNDSVVVTNAAINTVINILKIGVYLLSGFVFEDYLLIIILMSLSAALGSYVGALIRGKIKDSIGRIIIKVLITLICISNIISGVSIFLNQ